MTQSRFAADIPTRARVRRAGVDDDETILLCKSRVGTTVEVGLRSAGAVVDRDYDARRCSEFLGDVDVEAGFGGCATERCDLRKGTGCWCALA